jgi:hypothetical protein
MNWHDITFSFSLDGVEHTHQIREEGYYGYGLTCMNAGCAEADHKRFAHLYDTLRKALDDAEVEA